MRITEFINDLTWEPPGMTVDNPISDRISDPLPNTASFLGFIGAPGSGKSSLMMSMLTNPSFYHKAFHHIFFVCPASSRSSISGNPWEKHDPLKLHDELNQQVLNLVLEYSKTASHEKQFTLLILDDCGAELKNKEVEKMLKRLVWNRRHLRLTIWIMSQSFIAMPLSIRKSLSHCVMFRPRNKRETEAIFSELLFFPNEMREAIVQHVFPENDTHGFLFMNTNTGNIYKRFNLLKFED
jgi:hypothetical protein